ncbi:MAG: hypothetical protein ACKV2T_11345 [Kofleriaceae bacterium]
MDLELREALAFSEDRDAALGQLLPGSQDHDYFRCLRAQHRGDLAEADKIIAHWAKHHGQDNRYHRLQLRQWLYRSQKDFAKVADKLRDHFGVNHWHEREVEEIDPKRPTRLADDAFTGDNMLRLAIDHDDALSQVTDEGLYQIIGSSLSNSKRRSMLQRLGHTPDPKLVEAVVKDLATRDTQFGNLAVHNHLTRAQLLELVEHREELRSHLGWVSAVVKRMTPPRSLVDLEQDRRARLAHAKELWAFVGPLPDAINSLKVHALWHLLDTERRLGIAQDPKLFVAYLKLPRHANYLPHKFLDKQNHIAQVGQDFSSVTGLPPAIDDEGLVREYIHAHVDEAEKFAAYIDRAWLDAEVATARLLYGDKDTERATLTLGPARAAALRERVDLAWCVHNPTRFAETETIVLEADVKHVPELVVKVFRVDPHAYFLNTHREVNTDLDLDGLAASHEQVLRFGEPPVRRARRRVELPMCTRAGTYVIDLIGNGMSSRAVVHKGRLRYTRRIGAAGHVVTIVDEAGNARQDAHAIIGEREYVPDAKTGSFVVPFSTNPSRVPMLLLAGDIASVQRIDLVRETPHVWCTMLLDREGLTSGRTARVVVRARLGIAGAPASVAVLKRTMWDVTLTDRAGVTSTKSQPLALADDDATVLEFPVGEDTANVQLTIRGTLEIHSEQREQDVSHVRSFSISEIHDTTAIESLYLAHTAEGWVLSALGKTGEPRAKRPVTVELVHRWSRMQFNAELATDERGRVELGALAGIARVTATLGAASQSWNTVDFARVMAIHALPSSDVIVPLPPSRSAEEVIPKLSIVEMRDVPVAHPACVLVPLASGVAIRGLPPGTYHVRGPGIELGVVVMTATNIVGNAGFSSEEVVELSHTPPAIAAIERRDSLAITLANAGARTRVHVIGTTFVPSLVDSPHIGALRPVGRRGDRGHAVHYVSGRELGDEYRYILDRRGAKRFPGLLLDRPPLLLNPWARRTTSTDTAAAKPGGHFGAQAERAAAGYAGAPPPQAGAGGAGEGYVTYDFLGAAPIVLANLVPDDKGVVRVAAADLGRSAHVVIVVDDPGGYCVRYVPLPERPLDPRDLRLRLALDPARHVSQKKEILPLVAGQRIVIEDLATAKIHLVDSLEKAHGYLLALRDDATLREFSFVTKWHELPDHERREKYSKYACHELHLFLWGKDRPFFDAVVKPYLANKRTKTFVDEFLLDHDLRSWLEPVQFAKLNAFERALLARAVPTSDAIARLLADHVAVLPPDPSRDTRLIDSLLGAATLDGDDDLSALAEEATESADMRMQQTMMGGSAGYGGPPGMPMAASAPAPMMAPAAPPPAKMAKRDEAPKKRAPEGRARAAMDEMEMEMDSDLQRRDVKTAPLYRTVDKTQEWAENNWWHRTPQQSGADMITANRLWRDFAAHRASGRDTPFLSPSLGLAVGSFAEAMCALAVIDLPFVSTAHALTPDGARLEIVTKTNALAGSSQLLDGELGSGGPPLVIGMSFVRTDDRHDWVNGEQVDKYVDGPFATGVVYTCQVVLANPTSARQRIAALIQIPRGSIAVGGAKSTTTIDVALAAYGTHGHEVSFYFPHAGATPDAPTGVWSHFPVHVSRAGEIVAAAPSCALEVTSTGAAADPRSWPYVSQRGAVADVVAYLATANLAAIDLDKVAWRMRDRTAYTQIVEALEKRQAFSPTLWGYAWLHADATRIRAFLRSSIAMQRDSGPVLEMLDIDGEDLGTYEHLELAPLVNARTHRLGPKQRILNDGLSAQYGRFLDLVAHRPVPTAKDLVGAAHYLFAQDRVEPGLAALARVDPMKLADRMQYDYIAGYAACLLGNVRDARAFAELHREHPVDRWRHRFSAMLSMLDEIEGAAPAIVDPRSREQQHAELAAKQPAFEIALDRDGVVLTSQHVAALELRFFEMDVELLFSRQPFVQSDVSRFSFIEPGSRETIATPAPKHRVAWPEALRGKNVVVEAVGAGQRKAKVHYANDLTTALANQVGQVRVSRTSDQRALAATYVKVYARKHGGDVAFYKDGYTDLRGWFDYASLSTNDLDHVERFAILVCSDQSGAAILEASPPAR